MASAINPVTSSTSNTNSSASAAALGAAAPTEGMFLQLLVAQMQNQDPLNPTDGTQFVSQLAQFSELEQVTGIRQDIESSMAQQAAAAAAAASAAASGSSTGSSTSTNTSSQTSAT